MLYVSRFRSDMEGLQAEFQTLLREHTSLKRQVIRLYSNERVDTHKHRS